MKSMPHRFLLLLLALTFLLGCSEGNSDSSTTDGDTVLLVDGDAESPVDGDLDGDSTEMMDSESDSEADPFLRWTIDPEHPFFVFNVYMNTGPEEAANLADLIPDDVQPFFGVQLVGKYPYDDDPEHRQWVETMVDAFASHGIPTFVQAEAWNTRSDIPMSFYESLFERSPLFLGLVYAEFSANGLTMEGMDEDHVQRIIRAVETVSAYDGFLLWQDMGWEWSGVYDESGHPFVEAGSDPLLFDLFSRLGRHVILQDKHNGSGKRFQGPAAAMGWWSSGLINAWGVNSEDWIWWESGWGPLFGEHGGGQKAYDAEVARWNFPLAMTGQDWLADLAGGASVFSIEVGFGNGDFAEPTPAFKHVQLPFMRRVIENRILLSRSEFLGKVQVAYQPSGPWGYDMHNDDIFKGLYGPEESSLYEWLPSTGRYFYLPILPTLAGEEITAKYPEVIGTEKWKSEWKDDQGAKIAWFDERYPAVEGDSWFVNVGNRWFFMNPNENVDVATTFAFPLSNWPCLNFSGSIEPHLFGFITEEETGLSIRLSNYRIDGQGMLDDFGAEDIFEAYMTDPYDGDTRRTEFVLQGLTTEPQPFFDGTREFDHTATFADGALTIALDHNGAVDIIIPLDRECL